MANTDRPHVPPFDQLVEAARAGAGWALAILFRRYHASLLRYLGSQEPTQADDLASETWLDVASGLRRFEGGEGDFRAWLFTIARRRVIDLRRRNRRRRTRPAPPATIEAHAASGDVEAEAMANLSTEAAVARLVRLPADQAEVLLLRVLGDLSVNQVAAIMAKRPGTVRVLQHRALTRLAEDLGREPVTPRPAGAM
jgi:RNA polymerase sigma-70 factor (ECF subfamily)